MSQSINSNIILSSSLSISSDINRQLSGYVSSPTTIPAVDRPNFTPEQRQLKIQQLSSKLKLSVIQRPHDDNSGLVPKFSFASIEPLPPLHSNSSSSSTSSYSNEYAGITSDELQTKLQQSIKDRDFYRLETYRAGRAVKKAVNKRINNLRIIDKLQETQPLDYNETLIILKIQKTKKVKLLNTKESVESIQKKLLNTEEAVKSIRKNLFNNNVALLDIQEEEETNYNIAYETYRTAKKTSINIARLLYGYADCDKNWK